MLILKSCLRLESSTRPSGLHRARVESEAGPDPGRAQLTDAVRPARWEGREGALYCPEA